MDAPSRKTFVEPIMRKLLRSLILRIAHVGGARIVDYRTGRNLGKALIIPWRGKIHFIGLKEAVRASFLPQTRLTYWKQELGFTVHEPPDFANERAACASDLPAQKE
jgi:hypothetical protein